MKKRALTMLLVMMMVITTILAGCGQSGGSEQSTEESTEGETASSGEKEVLYMICNGTAEENFIQPYQDIVARFNEDNPYNVEIQLEFFEGEQYKTKLATLMAANDVPDIFYTWELAYLEPFVAGGKVADLTSYLEEDQEWKDSFSDGTLEIGRAHV